MSQNKLSRIPTWLLWVVGGAVFGIILRIVFGELPRDLRGPMSLAFLVVTPLVIGALTVYGARQTQRSWRFVLFAPWLTVLLMFLGCALALLEGSICIALLAPLFLACSSIGGLVMEVALRTSGHSQSQLRAIAVLPFLMIAVEGKVPLQDRQFEIRRSLHVNAAPETVWKEILSARNIQENELPLSLTHLIGVPKPLEGINVKTSDGEVRYSRWDRGVNFTAKVISRKDNESITWRYTFNESSFPEGSMDEHVEIGGQYFDLGDTTFNLIRLPENKTLLEVVAHYRVTTSINFYAAPAAAILGQDFLHMLLSLYKSRSETAEQRHVAQQIIQAGPP